MMRARTVRFRCPGRGYCNPQGRSSEIENRRSRMAAVQKFSKRVIDYAERAAVMADAAEGKRRDSRIRLPRWLVLPASGAALYAVARSDFFTRGAKDLVGEAKSRASDLNEELASRVRDTVAANASGDGAAETRSRQTASARRAAAR